MKILIDNGHGIDTPGKRSPDGLFLEYAYNREIASRVVSELTNCGYDAQLLVPEVEDISLLERVRHENAISTALGRENVIFGQHPGRQMAQSNRLERLYLARHHPRRHAGIRPL